MLEGVFPNGNQLLLRSFARMNRAATLPAVIHLLFAPSLFLLSPLPLQANLPARRSPPSLSAPLSFVNLFHCTSTPLKVSVYVRPSRPASVPLLPPPPSISAPAANLLSQTSDKSRASKLIIYRDAPESVALKG